MIPGPTGFIEAIKDKKKVNVLFHTKPGNGVLDSVCAPKDYGPGGGTTKGLNSDWLLDYVWNTGSHTLGLVPGQIVNLQVLGETFNPAQFTSRPSPVFGPPLPGLPQAEAGRKP